MPRRNDPIAQFCTITQVHQEVAKNILRDNGWNLEAALNSFFVNGHLYRMVQKPPTINENQIKQIYRQFSDPEDRNQMSEEGLQEFLKQIAVNTQTVELFIVGYLVNAPTLGTFPRDEFCQSMKKMGCDSIDSMRTKIRIRIDKINTKPKEFKAFYRWLFKYVQDGQRTISIDLAKKLWEIVLQPRDYDLYPGWYKWIDSNKEVLGVSRDVWELLLDFISEMKSDLSNFDPEDSWPSLFDEFAATILK